MDQLVKVSSKILWSWKQTKKSSKNEWSDLANLNEWHWTPKKLSKCLVCFMFSFAIDIFSLIIKKNATLFFTSISVFKILGRKLPSQNLENVMKTKSWKYNENNMVLL